MFLLDRFTEGVQEAGAHAEMVRQRYGPGLIDSEHVLIAMLERPDGTLERVLEDLKIRREMLAGRLDLELRGKGKARTVVNAEQPVAITWRFKRIIDIASDEADWLDDPAISQEHFLLAMLNERDTPAIRILEGAGVTYRKTLDSVLKLHQGKPGARSRGFEKDVDQIDQHSLIVNARIAQYARKARRIAADRKSRNAGQLRFSKSFQEIDQLSALIARRYGQDRIDLEHVLLAFFERPDKVVSEIMEDLQIDMAALAGRLDRLAPRKKKPGFLLKEASEISITPQLETASALAVEGADLLNDKEISSEHFLLAVLKEKDTPAARLLADAGLTYDLTFGTILRLRKTKRR